MVIAHWEVCKFLYRVNLQPNEWTMGDWLVRKLIACNQPTIGYKELSVDEHPLTSSLRCQCELNHKPHQMLRRLAAGVFALKSNLAGTDLGDRIRTLEAAGREAYPKVVAENPHWFRFTAWTICEKSFDTVIKPTGDLDKHNTPGSVWKTIYNGIPPVMPTSLVQDTNEKLAFQLTPDRAHAFLAKWFPNFSRMQRQGVSSRNQLEEYNREGSIVFRDGFPWAKHFTQRFQWEMHLYSLLYSENESAPGWLRNMYQGLCQRAFAQDPLLVILNACFRPDREYELFHYPYIAKFVKPNGKTNGFRHVDVDLNGWVKGKEGLDRVQMAISFNQENSKSCTEYLPGSHSQMPSILAELTANGNTGPDSEQEDSEAGPSPSQRISTVSWNRLDASMRKEAGKYSAAYNPREEIKWDLQPLNILDIRVTHGLTMHGAVHAKKNVGRYTIFPWFLASNSGQPHLLEVTGNVPIADLAQAHRDLHGASREVLGHPAKKGVNQSLAINVPLEPSCYIGRAVIGQFQWHHPLVQAELHKLFDEKTSTAFVTEVRERLIRNLDKAYADLRDLVELHSEPQDPQIVTESAGRTFRKDMFNNLKFINLSFPIEDESEAEA